MKRYRGEKRVALDFIVESSCLLSLERRASDEVFDKIALLSGFSFHRIGGGDCDRDA